MASNVAVQSDPDPIVACTVCRDIQNFDLLIEDMETELGEGWGDLGFADAAVFLDQPDADHLEFIAIAMDEDDESNVTTIAALIKTAVARDIKVVVIAEEVSPMVLHQLLRLGAKEFVPYPLPEGALHEAIDRLRAPVPAAPVVSDDHQPKLKSKGDCDGVVMPVHGLSGGVGATTFAVNLAWELANLGGDPAPRVCILDFDLQYGSVGTYLDLPRRDAVFELLSDTEQMDSDSFMQALLSFNDKLSVLTAPADMLPLDILNAEDIERVIEMARANFDYVIIDMPSTVVQWTETVLNAAHVYFALIELDMRSAQNTLRLVRALKAEDLPTDKLRFILNRAPKFTDLNGKSRVKRLAESLDISLDVQLPDGARQVLEACDHGLPLAESAKKNPLRKEIHKIAVSAHDLNRAQAKAG
ncbi:pilus assembly protein CpaE [Mesobaculum littorinae]|uniref:Pilus assembly protein CpaE n=1 Tax=Mesobaculum littorinae TaxID=2486419 RepID=A0A438AIR5_9RHOB|nr:AAA family ATPase [Mesobaculum littorinae]RVV98515.1 pilus assembly protein CpaE [Mesobaculum littorinae]